MPDDKAMKIKQYSEEFEENLHWQTFHDARYGSGTGYRDMARRRAPQSVSSLLKANVPDVDVQSPEIEIDAARALAAEMENEVKIDAVDTTQTDAGQRKAENIRAFVASVLAQMNKGRRLEQTLLEGQNYDGVQVIYLSHKMPPIPKPEELKVDYKGIDPKDRSPEAETKRDQRRDKALEKWYEEYFSHDSNFPWQWRAVHGKSIKFGPNLDGPDVHIETSQVSMSEAQRYKTTNRNHEGYGKKLRYNATDYWQFAGVDVGPDEYAEEGSGTQKKVEIITMAQRERTLSGDKWHVSRCVKADGDEYDKAKEIDTWDVPYEHSPYFVCASGVQILTESTPHLRYRAKEYPLYVYFMEKNRLETEMERLLAYWTANPFAIPLKGMQKEWVAAFEGMASAGLGVMEGSAGEKQFRWIEPVSGTGEPMVVPDMITTPLEQLITAYERRIAMVDLKIDGVMENKLLTGRTPDAAMNAPSTSLLTNKESAQGTVVPFLTNKDQTIKEMLEAVLQSIVTWAEVSGTKNPYPWRIRGSEPFARNPMEAGERGTITADDLETGFDLIVHTEGMTEAERTNKEALADVAREKGRLPIQDYLRQTGAADPQKREEELRKEKHAELIDGMMMGLVPMTGMYGSTIQTLLTAFSGMDVAAMSAPPMGATGDPASMTPGGTSSAPAKNPGTGVHNGTPAAIGAQSQSSNNGMANGGMG
jgi:hypothetical protein